MAFVKTPYSGKNLLILTFAALVTIAIVNRTGVADQILSRVP